MRAIDLSPQELHNYILKNVEDVKVPDFTMLLARYYENKFGGNIVINGTGKVLIEIAEGTHGDLVTGKNTPSIVVEREMLTTRTISYFRFKAGKKTDLDDPFLRQVIYRTLEYIPKDHYLKDYDRPEYHPGYYEFILTEENGVLMPIFIDYRDSRIYQV